MSTLATAVLIVLGVLLVAGLIIGFFILIKILALAAELADEDMSLFNSPYNPFDYGNFI